MYSSIGLHQADDPFCKDVRAKLVTDSAEVDKFSIFKGKICEGPELTCASLFESLPLLYSSIDSNQAEDPFLRMSGLN